MPIKELCEGFPGMCICETIPVLGLGLDHLLAEEFRIYLNYVRKLGLEGTPGYDFLRELFAKVVSLDEQWR